MAAFDDCIIMIVGFCAVGARERKTKVINNSVNPLWNEQFEVMSVYVSLSY